MPGYPVCSTRRHSHAIRATLSVDVVQTDDSSAVNAEEQHMTLQLMAEPRIATIPSIMAQTASSELVATAPAACNTLTL